jgi:hypothetical protein
MVLQNTTKSVAPVYISQDKTKIRGIVSVN